MSANELESSANERAMSANGAWMDTNGHKKNTVEQGKSGPGKFGQGGKYESGVGNWWQFSDFLGNGSSHARLWAGDQKVGNDFLLQSRESPEPEKVRVGNRDIKITTSCRCLSLGAYGERE